MHKAKDCELRKTRQDAIKDEENFTAIDPRHRKIPGLVQCCTCLRYKQISNHLTGINESVEDNNYATD